MSQKSLTEYDMKLLEQVASGAPGHTQTEVALARIAVHLYLVAMEKSKELGRQDSEIKELWIRLRGRG